MTRWRTLPLALLLVAVLLKGLLWSLVVPIWHAPDEPDHVIYAQTLARHPAARLGPVKYVPEEIHLLNAFMQLPAVALYPEQRFDFSRPDERAALRAALAAPRSRERETPRNAPRDYSFTGYHPPFYYWLGAAVLRALAGADLLARVAALRLLSVLLGTLAVAATYAFTALALPGRPATALSVAALVGFQPQFSFLTATFTNQALELTLFSVVLLLCALVLRRQPGTGTRPRWPLFAVLGVVLGAGLLTRSSFLAAALPLAVAALVDLVRAGRRRQWRAALGGWALAGVVTLILAGPWYGDALRTGGASTVASLGPGNADKPPVTLLGFARTYDLARYTNALFKGYWGLFGWDDTYLPLAVYDALRLFCLLTFVGLAVALVRRLARRERERAPSWPLLAVSAAGALAPLLMYLAIEFRIAVVLRAVTVLQGRYYLPGLAAQMLLVALAWAAFVPVRWRMLPELTLAAAMIALNWYALLGAIVPRYVGFAPDALLGIPWDRLTTLAPSFNRPPLLIAVFVLALLAQAALLLVAGLDWLGTLRPRTTSQQRAGRRRQPVA